MRTKLFFAGLLLNLGMAANVSASVNETPANDDGGGNAIYLDRHHVNCGFQAVNSLKLTRPSSWQIAYQYECTNVGEYSANYNTTPANADGGGNVIYLDRHGVDCQNRPLQYVNLYRPTPTQIAYRYNCGNNPMINVTNHYTPTDYDGGGNAVFLDRHFLNCPQGKVLSYFRLERPFANAMRYHYRCGSKG